MEFAELRFVCQEAAIDLAAKHERPLPPTVVLPGSPRTRLLTLPSFPVDDEQRHTLLAALALEEITGTGTPAWGFVAEADGPDGEPLVVVVYGARKHAPEITATTVDPDDGRLVEFVEAEELDPTAMPFLHPLQHAVDALPAGTDLADVSTRPGPLDEHGFGSGDGPAAAGGLPVLGQ